MSRRGGHRVASDGTRPLSMSAILRAVRHCRRQSTPSWRGGRVVECAGFEIRYTGLPYRGFESLPLRHPAIRARLAPGSTRATRVAPDHPARHGPERPPPAIAPEQPDARRTRQRSRDPVERRLRPRPEPSHGRSRQRDGDGAGTTRTHRGTRAARQTSGRTVTVGRDRLGTRRGKARAAPLPERPSRRSGPTLGTDRARAVRIGI